MTATGTFEVSINPKGKELHRSIDHFEFTKQFSGELSGTSEGILLSHGDPQAGEAGYIAFEAVNGTLRDKTGSFLMQQFGTIHQGVQVIHYEIVPGSGKDMLVGISGALELNIDADGTHAYVLTYNFEV